MTNEQSSERLMCVKQDVILLSQFSTLESRNEAALNYVMANSAETVRSKMFHKQVTSEDLSKVEHSQSLVINCPVY